MKCAAVIIDSSTVRNVLRSIVASNHAGVAGSKNETCHVRALAPTRYASVHPAQKGCGWRTDGSWTDDSHFASFVGRSQRLCPMITDSENPEIRYASRSGATAR